MRLTRKISARLSAHRRSRLAGPAVLLVALLTTGGVFVALSPAGAQKTSDDTSEIAKGRALFLVGCASCHGKNAEGILTERGNQYGPTLVGVGAAAVDFQVGTGRMPMAQPGSQALRKRPLYNQDEIDALGAFIASLGPGPAVPSADEYQAKTDDDEAVSRGGAFFRTNCTACHNFAGSGGALPQGKFAPKLTGVSGKHLFEAMETGPQQMPVFSNEVLSPQDKQDIISYLKKNEETPSYGGFTLGSIGPVSEGLFAWLAIAVVVGAGIWITSQSARSKKTTKKGDAS